MTSAACYPRVHADTSRTSRQDADRDDPKLSCGLSGVPYSGRTWTAATTSRSLTSTSRCSTSAGDEAGSCRVLRSRERAVARRAARSAAVGGAGDTRPEAVHAEERPEVRAAVGQDGDDLGGALQARRCLRAMQRPADAAVVREPARDRVPPDARARRFTRLCADEPGARSRPAGGRRVRRRRARRGARAPRRSPTPGSRAPSRPAGPRACTCSSQ